MATTFLDNLEESFFTKVNNEDELKLLLKKFSAPDEKVKIILDYYNLYLQKENWILSKMRKDSETLIVKNLSCIDEYIDVINNSIKKEYKKKVLIYLDNKDYPDLNKLNSLNIPFHIVSNSTLYNIDEFKEMRETINYYKSLVKDLTPLEQVTYVYDLIKSYKYNESSNKEESRYIKHIIKTGNIVCVGYTNFICQILSELGFMCYRVILTNINNIGHERIIIRIIDEKYDINNVFAFDATFDSAKNIFLCLDLEGKKVYRNDSNPVKENDKVIKQYDNLILYKFFLIPLIEYGLVFKNEKIKAIKVYSTYKNDIVGDNNYYQKLQAVHVNKRDINLEMFIKLMYNVKINEGYSEETIEELINDIILVNDFAKENQIELIKLVLDKLKDNNFYV